MSEWSVAGGGGKPPAMAAQATPPEGLMHAWCQLILKRSKVGVGWIQHDI